MLTTNSDAFHEFYHEHREEIKKYYFVFYLCPLKQKDKSFPILLIKKTNGSADINITNELEIHYFNCLGASLDIVGISFDGDFSYLKYASDMLDEIDELESLDFK